MSARLDTTTEGFMSVQGLAAILGCGYDVVRRYAKAPGIAELMCGVSVRGKQGLRYPVASMDLWRQLLALHQTHAVTPQTAAAVISVLRGGTDGNGSATTKSESTSPPSTEPIMAELGRIAAAMERIAVVQERLAGPKRGRRRKKKS